MKREQTETDECEECEGRGYFMGEKDAVGVSPIKPCPKCDDLWIVHNPDDPKGMSIVYGRYHPLVEAAEAKGIMPEKVIG